MKRTLLAGIFIVASGVALAGHPATSDTASSTGATTIAPVANGGTARQGQAQRQRQGQSQTVNNTVNGGGGVGGGSDGSGRAPDVISTGLVTANPCGVGASLGGSGANAGGFFQFLFGSDRCERRQDAQLMWTMGDRVGAAELMCTNKDVRWARYRTGNPCRQEIERWNRGER